MYDMPDMDANNISTAGGAKAAWFKDTEGNIMALVYRLELRKHLLGLRQARKGHVVASGGEFRPERGNVCRRNRAEGRVVFCA